MLISYEPLETLCVSSLGLIFPPTSGLIFYFVISFYSLSAYLLTL